MLTVKAMKSR